MRLSYHVERLRSSLLLRPRFVEIGFDAVENDGCRFLSAEILALTGIGAAMAIGANVVSSIGTVNTPSRNLTAIAANAGVVG
jgi:hypothetical protein